MGVAGGALVGAIAGARNGINAKTIATITTLPAVTALAAGNAIFYDHVWNKRGKENSTSSIIPAALGAVLAPVWFRASAPNFGSGLNGLVIGTAAGSFIGFTGGALYGAAEYGIDQITDGKASKATAAIGHAYDATVGKSIESAKASLGQLAENLHLPKLVGNKQQAAI